MIKLTLYFIIFLIFLFAFFIDKGEKSRYAPIPAGLLYSIDTGSTTIISEEVTNKEIFKNSECDTLPVFSVYTELNLPRDFKVRLTNLDNAFYVLSSTSTTFEATVLPAARTKQVSKPKAKPKAMPVTIGTEQKKPAINPNTVVKDDKDVVFNQNVLNNIIKDSAKTRFFSNMETEIGDVKVSLYSVTPYQNQSILKLHITNSQQQYFFIANTSLYVQDKPILTDIYCDPFVPAEKTIDCIILVPHQDDKRFTVKLTESGGKNRVFSIPFNML